jgi:hypothetical protein
MQTTIESRKTHLSHLQDVIAEAMSKVNAQKDTQLTRYIPGNYDGHLHHIKFLKLKKDNPQELEKLIKKHILEQNSLAALPSSIRSKSYLKKKRLYHYKFSRPQVDRLIQACEKAGAEYSNLIEPLRAPFQEKISLEEVAKLMKAMIRDKKIDKKLLATYERLLQEQTSIEQGQQ